MKFQIIDFYSQDLQYDAIQEQGQTKFLTKQLNRIKHKLNNIEDTNEENPNHTTCLKWFKNVYNFYTKLLKIYTITIFGKTKQGESVSVTVSDFKPYFFVKLPWKETNNKNTEKIKNYIIMKMWFSMYKMPKRLKQEYGNEWEIVGDDNDKECMDRWQIFNDWCKENDMMSIINQYIGIHKMKTVKRKILEGFTNNKKFTFLKIQLTNMRSFYTCKNIFEEKKFNKITNEYYRVIAKNTISNKYKNYEFKLYEANIKPILRFIHELNIKACGWVSIEMYKESNETVLQTHSEYNLKCISKQIKPLQQNDNSPINMMFYDIECDSSHGDFPQAIKDYSMSARELVMEFVRLYKKMNNPSTDETEKTKLFHKLEEKPDKLIRSLVNSIFKNGKESHNISKIYWKQTKKIVKLTYNNKKNFQGDVYLNYRDKPLYENIIEPLLNNLKNCSFKKYIAIVKKINEELIKTKSSSLILLIRYNIEQYKIDFFKKNKKELISFVCKILKNSLTVNYEKLGLGKIEIKRLRNKNINFIKKIMNIYFPPIEGDPVIQIGSCFVYYGEKKTYLDHILTLGTCDLIKDVEVDQCKTEEELLLKWKDLIINKDPDILSGYNIYGFDYPYLWDRAEELGIINRYSLLGKFKSKHSTIQEKKLSSSAFGDNSWREITTIGRIQIDLLKVIQRSYNLTSYKLDNVSSHFMSGKITLCKNNIIETSMTKGMQLNSFLKFKCMVGHSEEYYNKGEKFKITEMNNNKITLDKEINLDKNKKWSWTMAKDDVSPQDIFNFQKQGSDKRCIIAKYCIKDVILCVELFDKLDIMSNNIGMANVCHTPLLWIFTRGQGIKLLSLTSRQCREDKYLIPMLYNNKKAEGFEGAIVLNPNPGIYLHEPVSVLDFSSLYPSSMISENLSHDSLILKKDTKWLGVEGGKNLTKLGYEYVDIQYDCYETIKDKKVAVGKNSCRYVQPIKNKNGMVNDKKRGIIPRILIKLLNARKNTRNKIKYKTITYKDGDKTKTCSGLVKNKNNEYYVTTESGKVIIIKKKYFIDEKDTYNQFQKSVYDGLQLAYKITANSLYGQIGASTSAIYKVEIAASTTAVGRDLLNRAGDFAKTYQNKQFNDDIFIKDTEIVYGDTDSIFVKYNMTDNDGNMITDKKALKASIDISCDVEKNFKKLLKHPHNLEYEKTFWPFILFSKKRYVGNKYEFDPNYYKQTSMGIVLKRRDNADILKYVYGGIIDIIINQLNVNKSINFLSKCIVDILKGNFEINKFIITKSLRANYKDPDRIAHKVLADRIGERDPGNKPKPNDRIPYVYIKTSDKVIINEIYYRLTNWEKFGRYLFIGRVNNVIVMKISSDENIIKNKNVYLRIELKWDWDYAKQKGYSIEFISDIPMLYKIVKPRLKKPPIITIGKITYCKYELPQKDDLLQVIKYVVKKINPRKTIQDCNVTDDNVRIPLFENQLFHKKEFKIKKSTLQGDKIEHPDYVLQNNIEINYREYIERQIVKPVCQIYGLIIENLDKKWKFPYSKGYYKNQYKKIYEIKKDVDKTNLKIRDMKEKMVKDLLFQPIINQLENVKKRAIWEKFNFKFI